MKDECEVAIITLLYSDGRNILHFIRCRYFFKILPEKYTIAWFINMLPFSKLLLVKVKLRILKLNI